MEVTVELLEEKFEEYNKLYFGGRLLWPYDQYYPDKVIQVFWPIQLQSAFTGQ